MNSKNNKGFTLVELVITIVIVSILSMIGVREYLYYTEKAILSEAISISSAIITAHKLYYLEHKKYTYDIKDL